MVVAVLLCLGLAACTGTIQRGALMRATGRLQESDYAGALAIVRDGIEQGESSAEALDESHLVEAEALMGLGRRDEAIGVYQTLVKSRPQGAAAYQARARLVELGQPCAP